MRRLSKIALSLVLILTMLTSCKNNEYISTKEWLVQLALNTGLSDNHEMALTSLHNWGINFDDIELEEDITYFNLCYILEQWVVEDVHYETFNLSASDIIQDLLQDIDSTMSKEKVIIEEANRIITLFVFYINNLVESETFNFEIDNEIPYKEVTPYFFNEDKRLAQFHIEDDVNEGDVVYFESNERIHLYQVNKIEDGIASLNDCDLSYFESLDINSALQVDFSNAEITLGSEEESTANSCTKYMFLSKTNEFNIQDFTVRYDFTVSSLSFYVFKKTALDANLFIELNINNLTPYFKWKSNGLSIEEAFFKIQFDSIISTGVKKGNYRLINFDFSKINHDDLLTSLKDSWTTTRSTIDTVIPLAKIKIPVVNVPSLFIVLDLSIRVFVNGTMEIMFTTTNENGFEIRNNQLRLISDMDSDINFNIHASTGINSRIKVAANAFNQDLLDLALNVGINAKVASTLYFLDEQSTSTSEEIPYDLVEELLIHEDDIDVCSELNAYWNVDLVLNSSRSLAGKLGISKTFSLLNEYNGSLFDEAKYIENWQLKDSCSINLNHPQVQPIVLTEDRIILENYSMLLEVEEGQYIKIRGIPRNSTLKEVNFKSDNPEIATVSDKGYVTALQEGVTRIHISVDEEEVLCNILVKEK